MRVCYRNISLCDRAVRTRYTGQESCKDVSIGGSAHSEWARWEKLRKVVDILTNVWEKLVNVRQSGESELLQKF